MTVIKQLTAVLTALGCLVSCAPAGEPMSEYLFAFFPDNRNENVYYALSPDGYNYTTLGRAVAADTVSVHGGMRDPHILRGADGWFYMVATDMQSSLGWTSNRGLIMLRSRDLLSWEHHTVSFPLRYEGTPFADVLRVWAPQVIYDPSCSKYMLYFSLLSPEGGPIGYDQVFKAYADRDFTTLETEPEHFYDRGAATIDMDIVFDRADGLYHAVYKAEGEGKLFRMSASDLSGRTWSEPALCIPELEVDAEGPGIFRTIDDSRWILMFDCYRNRFYRFCESEDLVHFTKVCDTPTSGDFTPRHGTVIPVTASEAARLRAAFGK